jgi:hypothetical protein
LIHRGSGTLGEWTSSCERQAREWAERTATEQGLPPKVEDVATLRRILFLMGFLDAEGNQIKALW